MLLAGARKRVMEKKQFFFHLFSTAAQDKRLAALTRLLNGGRKSVERSVWRLIFACGVTSLRVDGLSVT